MTGDGDGHRCWLPCPAKKQRETSWRRRSRCQVTATDENIGRRALRRSRAGTSSSPRRCCATATATGVGRLLPRRISVGVSWRRRVICQVWETAESVGCCAPRRSRAGTLSLPRRWRATATAIGVGRLAPRRRHAGLLGVAGRDARQRRRRRV